MFAGEYERTEEQLSYEPSFSCAEVTVAVPVADRSTVIFLQRAVGGVTSGATATDTVRVTVQLFASVTVTV